MKRITLKIKVPTADDPTVPGYLFKDARYRIWWVLHRGYTNKRQWRVSHYFSGLATPGVYGMTKTNAMNIFQGKLTTWDHVTVWEEVNKAEQINPVLKGM